MDILYRNFYRLLYMHTNGYFSTIPYNFTLLPGDFFQLRNGNIILLGNIFRKGILDKDDAELTAGIRLNSSSWNTSDGVLKAYASRGTGEAPMGGHFQYSQQLLAFKTAGAFLFAGNNPEAVRIMNWEEIRRPLIIRMTQGICSFREVYLVTESVSLSDFTLAVAASDKGELEIATDTENFGLTDIFGHPTARTIQAKEIEYYYREQARKPVFFKAKKLIVRDDRRRMFTSGMLAQLNEMHQGLGEWMGYDEEIVRPDHSYRNIDTDDILPDLLAVNELNPNTALQYFDWQEANLDDIEKLFITYGANR